MALTILPGWERRHDETTWQPYEGVDAEGAVTPSTEGGRRLRPVD
ncbi:hypothetical protein [Embleya sp. NBC_00896]|nr:hypothetical protein OG928_33410 [Embleya sp. NBC_00896]